MTAERTWNPLTDDPHAPLRWRKQSLALVPPGVFDRDHVPDDVLARVVAVMVLAKRHEFLLVTYRPSRPRMLLCSLEFLRDVQTQAVRLAREHAINTTWAARAADPQTMPPQHIRLFDYSDWLTPEVAE